MALAPTAAGPLEPAAVPSERGAPPPLGGGHAWPSQRLAWYALTLFVLGTMMNFFDVTVFSLMIESIKRDFGLSEMAVGLLLGPAGVLFFLFVGIPLARLIDSHPRNIILGLGMLVTSGMTAVGGIVQGYNMLFFSRMCVGVGGSAHGPGVYSMLSDYFRPEKLHRAIAVLQLGFILGTGLASILGGLMLGHVAGWEPHPLGPIVIRNWQWVLIATGIPGIVIGLLIFMLPEPPRQGGVAGGKPLPIGAVLREIGKRRRVYLPMFVGLALSSIESQGIMAWRAPWMMRSYGWGPAEIGAWSGVIAFVVMPAGVALGTWLTERLGKRYKDAPLRATAIVVALASPFALAAPLMPTPELAMLMVSVSGLFGLAGSVPQNTAIQRITPNEMRGQVTAIYLFMFIVFGALGSFLVSLITTYVVGGAPMLWLSIAIVAGTLLPLSAYAISRAMKPYAEEMARMEAAA